MLNVPSMRDQVSDEEWQLRCDLAACYRLVAAYGWSDLVFTHISAKLPESVSHGEEHFLINPYGLMFDEITASSLVKVDMACNKLHDTPVSREPRWLCHSQRNPRSPTRHALRATHPHRRRRRRERPALRSFAHKPTKHGRAGVFGVSRLRGGGISPR